MNAPLLAFNRGLISPLALARTDVKRVELSAEIQTNWMPRKLGSMMLRPGTEKILTSYQGETPIYIPFVFSASQTALIEVTQGNLRFIVDEEVVQVPSVTTAITNGTFSGGITGWTGADQSGASSFWVNAGGPNYMGFEGTGQNYAIRKQTVTVAGGNVDVEHNLRFVVAAGIVTIRIGSTDGGDEYIHQQDLRTGTYSFAFVPSGDFHIQVQSSAIPESLLQSVSLDAAGDKVIPAPWGLSDLQNIRWDESADVLFVACDGFQQRRISRFTSDSRSWGIDLYQPPDGPFRLSNTGSITITPSARFGDITLTASQNLFYPDQVGALFSLTSDGQFISAVLGGSAQFTAAAQITGVGASQRSLGILITGTFSGTLTLQQSVGSPGAWIDIESWTAPVSTSFADGLDNQIIFYQVGFKGGNYTSGSATVTINNSGGSVMGIVRIDGYSSPTVLSGKVLQDLGNTTPTELWSEGAWSDFRGWPTAVTFFEGRLWWSGRGNVWGSVADAFESFDGTTVGDSGPIDSGIGSGPVDIINWMLPLLRLLLGGQSAEHSVRSSAIDTPLTPTNFSIKQPSTQGSTGVAAIRIDMGGMFINRAGTRLFDLTIENAYYSYDYASHDLTEFAPEILAPGVTRIAVQRNIDTRIHNIRADGDVGILVYDSIEEVKAWIQYHTQGVVNDVIVLPNPGVAEDKVYYSVLRTIDGVDLYFLERWALESECIGGTLNKNIDCHVIYSGVATTALSAPHLPNTDVIVWADGIDQGAFTTDGSGNFTVPVAVENAVIGLGYTAQYQSSKLAYAAQAGTALTQTKKIDQVAVIMQNAHYQGLKYGKDFDNLTNLPLVEDGKTTPVNTIWGSYDKQNFEFPGSWDTDSRLCLQAAAPRPVTLLAAVISINTEEDDD